MAPEGVAPLEHSLKWCRVAINMPRLRRFGIPLPKVLTLQARLRKKTPASLKAGACENFCSRYGLLVTAAQSTPCDAA
jgi:hypothetical protein